jgi:hypothetical protein
MYVDCYSGNYAGVMHSCGLPFQFMTFYPSFPEEAIAGQSAFNYRAFVADMVFWLTPLALWTIVFRKFGPINKD